MGLGYLQDPGGYGACHRCDATKSAAEIASCAGCRAECPFAAKTAPVAPERPIKEMCLYTLADGRIDVQDRFATLPGHSWPDEQSARIFALGYLYGLNPRATPDELTVQKVNN